MSCVLPWGRSIARNGSGEALLLGKVKPQDGGQKGRKPENKCRLGLKAVRRPFTNASPSCGAKAKKAMPIEPFRKDYAIVNVGQLEAKFEANEVVTPEELIKRRLIDEVGDGVRVLGNGELTKPLTVYAHHFSASARAKIEGAGGKAVVIKP